MRERHCSRNLFIYLAADSLAAEQYRKALLLLQNDCVPLHFPQYWEIRLADLAPHFIIQSPINMGCCVHMDMV
jgi:hypothetical protein